MAKVQFGAGVAEMRNKLGSTVYSRARGGAIARAYVTTGVRHTTPQATQRAAFKAATQRWYTTLTEAQRQSWLTFAAQQGKINAPTNTIHRSGQQWYLAANASLKYIAGYFIDDVPDTLYAYNDWAITTATCDPTTSTFNVGVTPAPAGSDAVIVMASPPRSAGVNNFRAFRKYVYLLDYSTANPANIWASYVAKLSAPVVGEAIGLLLIGWSYSYGFHGAARQVKVIAASAAPTVLSRVFNGTTSDHLNAADSASLRSPSTGLTIALWFKPTSASEPFGSTLIAKQYSGTEASWKIVQSAVTHNQIYARIYTSGGAHQPPNSTALTSGNWYFIALRWTSGSYTTVDIYNSDGSLNQHITTGGTLTGTLDYAAYPLIVGAALGNPAPTGNLANIYVHSAALSDPDLATLLAGTAPAGTPSAIWCPFYGANPEVDQSGHGNDLTVTGTTTAAGPP